MLGLQPKVFKIQINFDTSRKDVGESWWIFTENASRIAGRMGVTREPQPTDDETPKYHNLSVLRSWNQLIKWGTPSARGEESGLLVFTNRVACHLRLSEGE
jgi:hypothetical protein